MEAACILLSSLKEQHDVCTMSGRELGAAADLGDDDSGGVRSARIVAKKTKEA